MLTPLARARGQGSAKEGVRHWYLQRASALLLIPLLLWLFYAIVTLADADHETAVAFLSRPWNSACAVLVLVSGLFHAMLGLQVVIEDYVHHPAIEWVLLMAVKGLTYAAIAVGVVQILKISLS